MVARVDRVLRDELGVADGLADPNVLVLDPACGTGAYLVEVLDSIHATLKAQGGGATIPLQVKEAALTRVFGFEILPAPFVIAHMQLGLRLEALSAPLSEKERAGVYLTNSLTGWEPPDGPKKQLFFPELEAERDAADRVKRDVPILVILGNPPYNAFAGVSPAEELGLVEAYKKGLVSKWKIKKFNLDELYVRFFRLAERRIAERPTPGRGIVAFISSYSYLDDPSFVVMREKLLNEFDSLWFDSMNGDSRETGKLTPDGKPDPSVFSTEYNREGIKLGTAIGILVRKGNRDSSPRTMFREFWGVSKRQDLLESLTVSELGSPYTSTNPDASNRYSLRPSKANTPYHSWPCVTDLSAVAPGNGLMEKRGGALIDIDEEALKKRMRAYFDASLDWENYETQNQWLINEQASFDPRATRSHVLVAEVFNPEQVVNYLVRPFDSRSAYYTAIPSVWNRSRPALWALRDDNNFFLMTRPKGAASPEGIPMFFTGQLGDNDALRGHAYYFPAHFIMTPSKRKTSNRQMEYFPQRKSWKPNVSERIRRYLAQLQLNDFAPEDIWLHALAIGYSPAYLSENAEGVRSDWPRIPLPNSADLLFKSATLGYQVAGLLDSEKPLQGVTAGVIRSELRTVAEIRHEHDKPLRPNDGDFDLSAGWGHASKDGVVMPGRGLVKRRNYISQELSAIAAGAPALGLSSDQPSQLLGSTTCDIYLNNSVRWSNVPLGVWEYRIGGYQVIKKWLSYREHKILDRGLTLEEVRAVTAIARRIAAILLLGPQLDANYQAISQSTYSWPISDASEDPPVPSSR